MKTKLQATLTIGLQTVSTGDRVTTPYGKGVVISLDPFADMEIFVHLDSPKDLGSKFWFSIGEVAVIGEKAQAAA